MAGEENKALVRRHYAEVLSGHNGAVIDVLYAPGFQTHMADGSTQGLEGFKAGYVMMQQVFPDMAVTVEDQIAEGDKVVTRWRAHATQRGAFAGVPPTGKAVTITGIHIHRVQGGQITDLWEELDLLGVMRQLGS